MTIPGYAITPKPVTNTATGQGRNRASCQSTSFTTQTHRAGPKDNHRCSLVLLWNSVSQTCLEIKKKKFQGTCIKNKIKQIPRPQPKPTKLKFPEEAWYFAYISSSPDDSFQAIFGSSSPKVLDDTKRFFFKKKGITTGNDQVVSCRW